MELEKKDRLMLINQYLILEKLDPDPDNANKYKYYQGILKHGFESEYSAFLSDIDDGLSKEDCQKVQAFLNLYRFIKNSFDALDDKGEITEEQIRFKGFDGTYESLHLAFARHLINEKEYCSELRQGQEDSDLNSHCTMLDYYTRMFELWCKWNHPGKMTAKQIEELVTPSATTPSS
ncbi:YfbU family protein [Candidatus Sumerlaeota bacterium]|nr:YfbU family protein [Candidatus Sumerlaeota bacterium]